MLNRRWRLSRLQLFLHELWNIGSRYLQHLNTRFSSPSQIVRVKTMQCKNPLGINISSINRLLINSLTTWNIVSKSNTFINSLNLARMSSFLLSIDSIYPSCRQEKVDWMGFHSHVLCQELSLLLSIVCDLTTRAENLS